MLDCGETPPQNTHGEQLKQKDIKISWAIHCIVIEGMHVQKEIGQILYTAMICAHKYFLFNALALNLGFIKVCYFHSKYFDILRLLVRLFYLRTSGMFTCLLVSLQQNALEHCKKHVFMGGFF